LALPFHAWRNWLAESRATQVYAQVGSDCISDEVDGMLRDTWDDLGGMGPFQYSLPKEQGGGGLRSVLLDESGQFTRFGRSPPVSSVTQVEGIKVRCLP